MIHVETWQDLPITNEETLDKSADSARLDRRRGSASPPSSPLSRGGTDGRATFFKIKFTARSNGDDPFRRRGARRLSSGRRWCRCSLRPGSSTSSSLSHRLFHPTFRFLLLPSRYRVTEFAILPEPVSALDPLPKFFLTNLTVFFFSPSLPSRRWITFLLNRGVSRYIRVSFVLDLSQGLLYASFFLSFFASSTKFVNNPFYRISHEWRFEAVSSV